MIWHSPAQSSSRVEPSSRVFWPANEFSPAHEFFCSRKLRLAPQDYSPWTPPSDRFLVRSYPPASRHPSRQDLGATGWSPVHLARMRAKYCVPYVSGPNRLNVILSLRRIRDPSARRDKL